MPYYKRQEYGTSNYKTMRGYKANVPTSLRTTSNAYKGSFRRIARTHKRKHYNSDIRINKVVTEFTVDDKSQFGIA